MFVMYKVRQVRNTGSQALAFELDPHNIVAVAPDKESNDTLDDAQLLGSQNLTKVEVPAGQTKNVGTCFIKEVSSSGAARSQGEHRATGKDDERLSKREPHRDWQCCSG